jgi:SAM-dependent methyltransferase
MHTMPSLIPATSTAHALGEPSPWIMRWSHLLRPGCEVLDVACGSGRHLQWFASRGHPVSGVDQDVAAARIHVPAARVVEADIENGPWPFATSASEKQPLEAGGRLQTFGAVVVTNYLWRPLLPTLLHSLAPGAVLLYETFAAGNETVGRPARPDFLLRPGELLQVCAHLHVVAYENGFVDKPPRFIQRIAAFAPALPAPSGTEISRHPL